MLKCFLQDCKQVKDAFYHGVWDGTEVPGMCGRVGKRNERPKNWKGRNESVFAYDTFVYNENPKESEDLFTGFTKGEESLLDARINCILFLFIYLF